MNINAEFNKRVVVHSEDLEWMASPMAGVYRRPLDRVGGEVARATTIVKYDPGSHFSAHVHTGGEEFIVLDGVFQDEHGDFPAGSYIRNPPQSKHTPGSEPGCTIFVKLWQFDMEDRTHVRLNMNRMASVPHKEFLGVSVTPLYADEHEDVSFFTLEPNATLVVDAKAGAEALVLAGSITEKNDVLKKHSWLRVPEGGTIHAKAGTEGARLWVKTGHMNRVNEEAERVLTAS